MPYLTAAAITSFGELKGLGTVDLMAKAADEALDQAGLEPGQIDGLLCGYAVNLPHLMLASLFAERYGLSPAYAHGIQMGGASGAGMLMLAGDLIKAGRCRHVLVIAGENRLSGMSRDAAIAALAQVGDPVYEVPHGTTVPAYYALLASQYMAATGLKEDDLAAFAVLMRSHAIHHPKAHYRHAISVDDVLESRVIAAPLKLLDCCPISDGAVAILVSAEHPGRPAARLRGAGQGHRHQHLSAIRAAEDFGARDSLARALEQARCDVADVNYLGIYDSFTITLAILLEDLGLTPRGQSAAFARSGHFDAQGEMPLNTHGGLLSFGHSGVAGGLAHIAECYAQLSQTAGTRQIPARELALIHADGGVLSAHVSLIFDAC
ncbi:MAG: thiolase family protein [Betaproteobacteria bacterium]|nr:thiolase family protein [Betaproteobacteria bacterium]